MLQQARQYLNHFAHLFFPHTCEGCGSDILEDDTILCSKCRHQLPETGFISNQNNPVEKIFYGRLKIITAGALFYFTKNSLLQHLIIQLKYRGNKDAGIYLGKLLGAALANSERFNHIDVIMPLPLNPAKERKRGYNQAALIANGIASVWPKCVETSVAQRSIFTDTQTHKDRIARWQTMQNAFAVSNSNLIQNKNILLIDDIITTGATLEACGEKILQIPGTTLSIATVAYTI